MPAAARTRVDGYVRVSRVGKRRGPSFISPSVQREAIEEWTARQGFELAEVFEELDETGARADRPLLALAVRRIEYRATSALVVWRVDRFGRSLNDGVRIIERIRAVGGGFYSVQDGLDISTDAGRLALRILLSVAEFRLDVMRENWEIANQRAIRRGVHVGWPVPVGYRKTRSGRLRPDPTAAPVLTEMFRLRAEGASLRAMCRFLESHQVKTGSGNSGWSEAVLSHMLRSPVYIGEVRCGRFVNANAHAPLTDPATWEAARQPRNVLRHDAIPGLVTGLARCAGCQYSLVPRIGRKPPGGAHLVYGCRKYHASGQCPAPTHMHAGKLEPYVLEAALSLLASRRRRPEALVKRAEMTAEAAAEDMIRYRDNDRIARTIGEQAFLTGLAVRQRRLSEANLALADARAHALTYELPSVRELRRRLPGMTHSEKRDLIKRVIDVVFVAKGNGAAEQRVTVCPAGTAPRQLPGKHRQKSVIRTITPRRGWLNPNVEPAAT
jgi:DNA invertase Pin-like site-specific DNA recombinase